MIEQLAEQLQNPASLSSTNVVDKINFKLSTILFFSLATLTTLNSYVGDPIDCWTPEYFTSQWIQYVDNICWMRNTYYIPREMSVERGRDELEIDWELTYYQWVPIILGFLALTFLWPNLIWHRVMRRSVDINKFVEALQASDVHLSVEERYEQLEIIAKNLEHVFEQRALKEKHSRLLPAQLAKRTVLKETNRLCIIYLMIKVIYICVAVFDMWFLTLFFGGRFYMFGIETMANFSPKEGWEGVSSQFFPKITLCDFYVRELGSLKTHTVMCVLTINLFTEKIFLIVWTMLWTNIFLTSGNLLVWLWRLVLACNRVSYVSSMLRRGASRSELETQVILAEQETVHRFVSQFLRPDGVFFLKMFEINTNKCFGSDLVRMLWNRYLDSAGYRPVRSRPCAPSMPREMPSYPRSKDSSVRDTIDGRGMPVRGSNPGSLTSSAKRQRPRSHSRDKDRQLAVNSSRAREREAMLESFMEQLDSGVIRPPKYTELVS